MTGVRVIRPTHHTTTHHTRRWTWWVNKEWGTLDNLFGCRTALTERSGPAKGSPGGQGRGSSRVWNVSVLGSQWEQSGARVPCRPGETLDRFVAWEHVNRSGGYPFRDDQSITIKSPDSRWLFDVRSSMLPCIPREMKWTLTILFRWLRLWYYCEWRECLY